VYYEIGNSTDKNFAANVSGASYTHTGLQASTTYYYYIKAKNSAGESGYSSYTSATTSSSGGGGTSAPSAPTGVTATAQSSSSISVSWNSVSGASGYRVYRATSSSGSYAQIASPTTTSYTNTGLSVSTTYYYKVSAYNSDGESSQSSAVSAKTQAPPLQKPNAPYGSPVVNSQTTTSITLGWNASSNATGYKLYRATGDSDSFTVVYTGSARTYMNSGLTSGVPYKYKVTARNSAGESEFSDVLTYKKL
jgi:fibronectin type 3 domain-containing protein